MHYLTIRKHDSTNWYQIYCTSGKWIKSIQWMNITINRNSKLYQCTPWKSYTNWQKERWLGATTHTVPIFCRLSSFSTVCCTVFLLHLLCNAKQNYDITCSSQTEPNQSYRVFCCVLCFLPKNKNKSSLLSYLISTDNLWQFSPNNLPRQFVKISSVFPRCQRALTFLTFTWLKILHRHVLL